MTKQQQLVPTVALSRGGVDFSKVTRLVFGSYALPIMSKNRCGNCYTDNPGWQLVADLAKYNQQVPFDQIYSLAPVSDIYTSIVEPARCVQSDRHQVGGRHVFIGFTQAINLPDEPTGSKDIPDNHDGVSSIGDTGSIFPLYDGPEDFPEVEAARELDEPPCEVMVYMARSASAPGSFVEEATNNAGGSGKTLAQAMSDLMIEMAKIF